MSSAGLGHFLHQSVLLGGLPVYSEESGGDHVLMPQAGRMRSIGGAVRWEDEAATGYLQLVNPEGGVIPDVNNPYLDDGIFSADAWVSYGRPIMNEKVDWNIRLNVRNLVGEGGNIPVKIDQR